MDRKNFQTIEVEHGGRYILVPEQIFNSFIFTTALASDDSKTTAQKIAELVRKFRASKDRSQIQLAQESKLSEKTIRNIEAAASPTPQPQTIKNLCAYFGDAFKNELAIIGVNLNLE